MAIDDIVGLRATVICKRSCEDDRLSGTGTSYLTKQILLLLQEPRVHQDGIDLGKPVQQIQTIRQSVCGQHVVFRGLHHKLASGKAFRLFFFHHEDY